MVNFTDLTTSFLLNRFHDFYTEVVHQKQHLASRIETHTQGSASDEASPEEDTIHPVQSRLLSILEEQALEARRQGGEYGISHYKEAQYAMAALADEIFLNMDWSGKEAWKSNLLESKLFGSHVAGEQIFHKVDNILKERDPAFTEMSAIYLLTISLGFQGRFRGREDIGQLDDYRNHLFRFIFQRNPDLGQSSRLLFPDAYAYTLEQGTGKRLPHLRNWIALIVGLVVLVLLVSHGIWDYLTEDLASIAGEILLGSK
jgi:type VI secretion system protein ImpK